LDFLLALFTAATVGVLLVPLLRARVASTNRLDNDLAIYRDQLAELERERAAGRLSESDATAARIEIERRILAAADKDSASAPKPAATLHRYLPPALCLLVPAFALGLYLDIGQPGLPSAPFIPRAPSTSGVPTTAPAGESPALAQQIAAARKRLEATPDDPATLSALGELLTEQADGVVPQPAVDAFTKALSAHPDDPRALFYLGLHEAQAGEPRVALTRWLDLEARSPEDASWLPTLRAEIDRVSKEAKIDPLSIKPDRVPAPAQSAGGGLSVAPSSPMAGMPQPTQEQMAAMAKMSPLERQQAIRGMVDQLDAKQRANPTDRDGWLRLAKARGVLGQPDKAAEAYAKADELAALEPGQLVDWAEAEVRQIKPGTPPSPEAVSVLQRLEKAEPDNGLALFYLGAASFANGDKADAARRWKKLLALLPSDAPIRAMLEARIKEAE
jgi:cytochrome c-type biogenesis protein CcmH